jgi:hypothetical protein
MSPPVNMVPIDCAHLEVWLVVREAEPAAMLEVKSPDVLVIDSDAPDTKEPLLNGVV